MVEQGARAPRPLAVEPQKRHREDAGVGKSDTRSARNGMIHAIDIPIVTAGK
jgi:hypothetical protein